MNHVEIYLLTDTVPNVSLIPEIHTCSCTSSVLFAYLVDFYISPLSLSLSLSLTLCIYFSMSLKSKLAIFLGFIWSIVQSLPPIYFSLSLSLSLSLSISQYFSKLAIFLGLIWPIISSLPLSLPLSFSLSLPLSLSLSFPLFLYLSQVKIYDILGF